MIQNGLSNERVASSAGGAVLFEDLTVARAISAVSNPVKRCGTIAGIQGMVLWERNSDGPVEYLSTNHHTLSVYLGGGSGTYSCEEKAWGFSDAICLLPKGLDTRWEHNGYVKNLHLYFTDEDIAALSWKTSSEPVPSIYGRDSLLHGLAQLIANELNWSEPTDRLALDHLVLAMLSQMSRGETSRSRGLPAALIQKLDERMYALEQGVASLESLAQIANMSPRHLSRQYKVATHNTLMQRQREIQIELAKTRLNTSDSLLAIAQHCGFSSQSHFSRVFREHTGLSPKVWRRART